MTDANDNDDVSDSGRPAQDKSDAIILDVAGPEDDPQQYLVEYPDGSVEYEPATARNRALFEDGLYSKVQGHSEWTTSVTGDTVHIELDADVLNNMFKLSVDHGFNADDATVNVPQDKAVEVLQAIQADNTGEQLYWVYQDILDGQVRRGTVRQFLDRFDDDRIEVTEDGWILDDTFLVDWDAENYLATDVTVHNVGTGTATKVDESKQAVYLDLHADGSATETTPDGDDVLLTESEQEFLVSVEVLLYPEQYENVGVQLVENVEQARQEASLRDLINELASSARVTGFTDSKTGQFHGSTSHSFDKHRLDDSPLNVTEEVCDMLWSHKYDHAGVHEMLYRKNELVERGDIDVFTDTDDDDSRRWDRIRQIADQDAPIAPWVGEKLQNMYGSRDL